MKKLETFRNYIAEQTNSDSGDPLVTSLVIIGVMVVAALIIYVLFGEALLDRGDDIVVDIEESGTQFDDRGTGVGRN